jgi:hypothetical protein
MFRGQWRIAGLTSTALINAYTLAVDPLSSVDADIPRWALAASLLLLQLALMAMLWAVFQRPYRVPGVS